MFATANTGLIYMRLLKIASLAKTAPSPKTGGDSAMTPRTLEGWKVR